MKSFWKVSLAALVGSLLASIVLAVFSILILIAISNSTKEKTVEIKAHTILKLSLNQKIEDRATDSPFDDFNFIGMFPTKSLGLNDIVKNIKKAKKDENIDGIYLNLSGLNAGIATIEEIRKALKDFKSSDKFIISYANYYSQRTYYLASISDKIYLQPEGALNFVGLSAQLVFFKQAFDKFGIKPIIIRHGKFKSAVEPFILDKMSEANREQISTYMGSIWNTMLENISSSRNIKIVKLNQIADSLLISSANAAVKYHFIDSLIYKDELEQILKEKTKIAKDKKLKLITLSKYKNVLPSKKKKFSKNKIAVIYASGEIVIGKGDKVIGSESLSETIKKARKDKKIKAIVLRVNSPGGSALASDIIWREMILAKKEKPLIVSMGDVAASGGYYISCAADTIVAQKNTITGSIGVFGVLFNIQKLMNQKLGITFDYVNTNKYSDIGSATRPMKIEEKALIKKGIEKVYNTFISHVAKGRNMTKEEVDKIGQGRVWSGANALENGLIDTLGGLNLAVSIAAKKAGLDNYRIVNLPEKKSPFKKLIEELSKSQIKLFNSNNEMDMFMKYYQSLGKLKGIQARMPMYIKIQ